MLVISLAFFVAPRGATQTRVYVTEEDALARALDGADSVTSHVVSLTREDAEILSRDLGTAVLDSTYVFHLAVVGSTVTRCMVVVDAMGQYQPITLAVTLRADGLVEGVQIMVYREARGSEVRRRAFLEQFEGKTADGALRLGGSIRHITGATISSRGVTDGVRLAVRLQRHFLAASTAASGAVP
jgi:Na+-translocating ferredoxin:NAD+ oxidoreductase RnfG subunit